MMMRKTCLTLLLLPLIALTGCDQGTAVDPAKEATRITLAPNEHERQFGDYIVHVNALTTDQLPAAVAQGYGISRSQNRAMLNVSVRRNTPSGQKPVTASVDVVVKNLSNQIKDMTIREIRETDPLAIYYIGEVAVNHEETLVFKVDLKPEGAEQAILLSYRQQFFTE